jgi:hypothetical protein
METTPRRTWTVRALIAALAVALVVVGLVVSTSVDPRHPATDTAAHATTTTSTPTSRGATTTVPPTTVAPTTVPPTTVAPTSTTTTVPATTTTTTATTTPGVAAPAPVAGQVTAVGDSIMIDIQPYLQADVPGVQVDGLVSRQFESGIAVVQADRASGTLGKVLVVELGTNGTVTPADVDAMMQAAAGVSRVVFVNLCVPRSWEAPDNAVLAAGVARYPGIAVLADWNAEASPHPEWFTEDQVHLNPAGAAAMAALIAQYV